LNRFRSAKILKKSVINVIAFLIVMAFLFPYVFMVSSAFKSRLETFAYPPIFINFQPTLEHFTAIFSDINILFYMKNSSIVSIFCTIVSMLIAIPATYALARYKFRFREGIAFGFLILQMIPGISVVFSLFFIAKQTGLQDTYTALILSYLLWNVPYAIWMLRGFVESIPVELEEAAIIDGCTRFKAFILVTLPLMAGGLAASAILIFIGVWNEFAISFFLTSTQARTMPTTIAFFMTHAGIKWGPMFAAATIGTLPVVIFSLLVRKYFVSALTLGAVKG
jgi:multiple sugar transport system permease protein